jgi:peptidoglycan hydrolase-like protein with peptidoglycan-binding domain
MSDIGLLITGIISPEPPTYNSSQILQSRINAIKISKNSQLHQLGSNAQIIPPEFSEPERPLLAVNTQLNLTKKETFKRLTQKFQSKLPPILAEYQRSPKNNQDSFSSCTQVAKNEINPRQENQNKLSLCSGNTKLQVMKVAASNTCTINNRASNQILIATTLPNLTPNLNGESLPTLRFGQSGISVKILQRVLLSNGYVVPVDGMFGALTETAVKAFQSQRELTEDGIVGGNTWRELTI